MTTRQQLTTILADLGITATVRADTKAHLTPRGFRRSGSEAVAVIPATSLTTDQRAALYQARQRHLTLRVGLVMDEFIVTLAGRS